MSKMSENSLPGHNQIKQQYPEAVERLEQNLELYADTVDFNRIFSDPEVPEIVSQASNIEDLELEELLEDYEEPLVRDLIDYGLISYDMETVRSTVEGEDYLALVEYRHRKTADRSKEIEEPSLEQDYSHLWIPKSEAEEVFRRYDEDRETIRNVFAGNSTPEEKINWDELPETPEDLEGSPEWLASEDSYARTNVEWVRRR